MYLDSTNQPVLIPFRNIKIFLIRVACFCFAITELLRKPAHSSRLPNSNHGLFACRRSSLGIRMSWNSSVQRQSARRSRGMLARNFSSWQNYAKVRRLFSDWSRWPEPKNWLKTEVLMFEEMLCVVRVLVSRGLVYFEFCTSGSRTVKGNCHK